MGNREEALRLYRKETKDSPSGRDIARKSFGIPDDLWLGLIRPYEDVHKIANDWYGEVPSFESPRFPQFVVSSRELALLITHRDSLILGLVQDSHLGYAVHGDENPVHKGIDEICLSQLIFNRHYMEEMLLPTDVAALSISVANGIILHEAAHLFKSDPTITDTLKKGIRPDLKDDKKIKLYDRLLPTIMNVGEDIYIEEWLYKTYPFYKPFVEATHEFVFSELELVKRFITLLNACEPQALSAGVSSVGETEWELKSMPGAYFVDLLIALKNPRFAEYEWGPAIKPYQKYFAKFMETDSRKERAQLAHDMTAELIEDELLDWIFEDERSVASLAGVGTLDEEAHYDKNLSGEAASVTLTDEKKKEKLDVSEADSKIVRKISEALEKDKTKTLIILKAMPAIKEVPSILIEKNPPIGMNELKPDPRFLQLGQKLRYALTRNWAPGPPLKRGTVLVSTRLTRIVTDGKIFSHYEKRPRTAKDYEIVILVDTSGSMNGSKVEEAMKVGLGNYLSLRGARIRTMLLCHTSRRHSAPERPILYILGGPKDSLSRVAKRAYIFQSGTSGLLKNNYDGFAIEASARIAFTDKPRKKWLIVISDGQPSGRNYGGDEAVLHTQEMVRQARRKSIDVVSITIEAGVYQINDKIYGANKNVKTTSSKVLHDLIYAMFIKGEMHNGKKISNSKR